MTQKQNPPVEAITLDELGESLSAFPPELTIGNPAIMAGHVFDYVRDAIRPEARRRALEAAAKLRVAQATPDPTSTTDYRGKIVARDVFTALGIHDAAIDALFAKAEPAKVSEDGIYWDELVCLDGMLALAVLPPGDIHAMGEELRASGAPITVVNAQQLAHFLYAAASMYVPEGAWSRPGLQSSVAAGLMLKLAEQAWGKKRIIVAQTVN